MTEPDPRLGALARADADALKAFAEDLLPHLGDITVQKSRTGLVMLPMRDTAQGTAFHLGEVLVSEAKIQGPTKIGYGMRRGPDLEAAMAMAVVDLALAEGVQVAACESFCAKMQEALMQADSERLRRIEATRVEMETF